MSVLNSSAALLWWKSRHNILNEKLMPFISASHRVSPVGLTLPTRDRPLEMLYTGGEMVEMLSSGEPFETVRS